MRRFLAYVLYHFSGTGLSRVYVRRKLFCFMSLRRMYADEAIYIVSNRLLRFARNDHVMET